MATRWRDIRRNYSTEEEAEIQKRVQASLARIPLAEVRRARQMTQARLAEVLHVDQGAISKLEQRSDMYLSTLRSYIEALGGQLEMRAIFPKGEIMLEYLGDLKEQSSADKETEKPPEKAALRKKTTPALASPQRRARAAASGK